MEKIVYSVDELTRALGIGRDTAYKLIATPGFPVAKIGARTVIPIAGLHAWLAAGGTAPRTTEKGAEA